MQVELIDLLGYVSLWSCYCPSPCLNLSFEKRAVSSSRKRAAARCDLAKQAALPVPFRQPVPSLPARPPVLFPAFHPGGWMKSGFDGSGLIRSVRLGSVRGCVRFVLVDGEVWNCWRPSLVVEAISRHLRGGHLVDWKGECDDGQLEQDQFFQSSGCSLSAALPSLSVLPTGRRTRWWS